MARFVIVHGAWGGGWEWRDVADELSSRGHLVATPTLTGMGEPPHRIGRGIGLATHAEDVVQAIRAERAPVVLVGHSYGGMPVTVAAGRAADRIAGLVYVDAFVPSDGQSETDLSDPDWTRTMMVEPAQRRGGGWLVPFPFPDDLDDLSTAAADRYRHSWQPLATFTETAEVDPRARGIPTAFVHCVGKPPGEDAFGGLADAAAARGWPVIDIDSGHDVQLEQPVAIADVLARLAVQLVPGSRHDDTPRSGYTG